MILSVISLDSFSERYHAFRECLNPDLLILIEFIEVCDFFLECLDGLNKLLIFIYLRLKFMAELQKVLPEFIKNNFFLGDKIQINNFRNFNFHFMIGLFKNLVVSELKTFFEGIKRNKRVGWESTGVDNFANVCFD